VVASPLFLLLALLLCNQKPTIMGHDISAFKVKLPDSSTEREEVAYIRFAMWNTVGIYLFYESLEAQKYNAGCSGSGESETYTLEQIKAAKAKLNYIVGDDDIIDQIENYSNSKESNPFKEMLTNLFGNSPSLTREEMQERFSRMTDEINEFFDKIIATEEEVVVIDFC